MTDDKRTALNEQVATLLGWRDIEVISGRLEGVAPDATAQYVEYIPDFAGDWAAAGQVLAHFTRTRHEERGWVLNTTESRGTRVFASVWRDGVRGKAWGMTGPEAAAKAAVDWAALRAAGAREGE